MRRVLHQPSLGIGGFFRVKVFHEATPQAFTNKDQHQIFPLLISDNGDLFQIFVILIEKRQISPVASPLSALEILGDYKQAHFSELAEAP